MIKKRYIFIEIIILCLLFSGLGFLTYRAFEINFKTYKEYNTVFHDVDGLIVGSPVRIMGVAVGHITNIKNLYDDVHLSFIITAKDVTIPPGAIATVQFTGLAGAKSLELMPPNYRAADDSPITTVEPMRVNKLYSVQSSITESLVGYTKGLSKVIGDKPALVAQNFINDSISKTHAIGECMDTLNLGLSESNKYITKASANLQNGMSLGISAVDMTNVSLDKVFTVMAGAQKYNSFVSDNLSEKTFLTLNKKVEKLNKAVKNANFEKETVAQGFEYSSQLPFYIKSSSKLIDNVLNVLTAENLEKIEKNLTKIQIEGNQSK